MIFETVALSVITVLLLILMLSRKSGTLKLLLGVLTSAAAIASMVFFILMQRTAGNPDAGKEMLQLYIPCGIYLIVALCGILVSASIHRKQKKEKEAKRALKDAKKREAEAKETT